MEIHSLRNNAITQGSEIPSYVIGGLRLSRAQIQCEIKVPNSTPAVGLDGEYARIYPRFLADALSDE